MNETIAVVGAGIAGLLLARELKARGEDVVVLEKSRGLGGRLATKRVEAAVFDSGAQYFTAKSERFAGLVAEWAARGVVAPWPGASAHRWIAKPSMNALGKCLAEGLDVRRESKVLKVQRDEGGWELTIENQKAWRAGSLVLTAPLPQSLALLLAGGVALPQALMGELAALTYHPCLALLLTLEGPSTVPAEGLAFSTGPVRWIADNTQKGISPGVAAAVTVHVSPAFAAEHFTKTEPELAALVLPGIESHLGSPVMKVTLQRWKFSEPTTTPAQPCVWLPDLGLGLAGDALGGPRVEGAALSGLALADQMKAKVDA
ncbi:MAG: FAD-dependent oxidoreductase [Opitutaceae bacterium]|nr:FAD-dependent oxidoreductase [Opitutaceae bacterium]